jgi:hypothetical protein
MEASGEMGSGDLFYLAPDGKHIKALSGGYDQGFLVRNFSCGLSDSPVGFSAYNGRLFVAISRAGSESDDTRTSTVMYELDIRRIPGDVPGDDR